MIVAVTPSFLGQKLLRL